MTLQSCITSRAFFPGQGQVVSFVGNDSSWCPHTWMNTNHEDSKLKGDWGINKKANISIMYMESYSIQDIHVCPLVSPNSLIINTMWKYRLKIEVHLVNLVSELFGPFCLLYDYSSFITTPGRHLPLGGNASSRGKSEPSNFLGESLNGQCQL